MLEQERLIDLIRQLVEDRGDVMPAWSLPIDARNYTCSYCGAIASRNYNERIFMDHDDDCPVHLGQRLLDDLDNRADITTEQRNHN
jgi:hypothetical protein